MSIQAIIKNFVDTVTQKYFCFEGRTSRDAFWQFFLVYAVVSIILGIIPVVGKFLVPLWNLAILCPYLGITARRLHDTGKSGWLQLLGLIPFIGWLIVLILCIPEGAAEANQYGEADAQ